MPSTQRLLTRLEILLDQRQDDIARAAARLGVDYRPHKPREFLEAVRHTLGTRRLQRYEQLKVVAAAGLLAGDYDLLHALLEHLDAVEGAAEVDADLVAATIRAMARDALLGRAQDALARAQVADFERFLQQAYTFGLPDFAAVQPLFAALARHDAARAKALEQAHHARMETTGRDFGDRLAQARAQRELRAMVLPVYEGLIAAGDLPGAARTLARLYTLGLSDFAPVATLADAYLAAGERARAEALVAEYLHDVGEPLGELHALDAVRYQNAHFGAAG